MGMMQAFVLGYLIGLGKLIYHIWLENHQNRIRKRPSVEVECTIKMWTVLVNLISNVDCMRKWRHTFDDTRAEGNTPQQPMVRRHGLLGTV